MAFMDATRQNWIPLNTKSFALGDMTQIDMPRWGYLSKIVMQVTGTLNVAKKAGAATYKAAHDGKPFGLIREIRLKVNSGLTVAKLSGYQLYLQNLVSTIGRTQYPDVLGTNLDGGLTGTNTYKFGTAEGANAVSFFLTLPVALTERDPMGLLLLQTPDTTVTLEIDWAPASELFTLTADAEVTWTGSLKSMIEVFTVPANKADWPALDVVHSLIGGQYEIPAVGETPVEFERGNIYVRSINRLVLNNAPAPVGSLESIGIRYNGNQYPYQRIEEAFLQSIQRQRYGRDLPAGVYVWDFFTTGTHRDWINSAALTEFEQLVSVSAGATLGQNNNRLETVREILIPVGTR